MTLQRIYNVPADAGTNLSDALHPLEFGIIRTKVKGIGRK